jgi:exosortase/archaeosortase family protein
MEEKVIKGGKFLLILIFSYAILSFLVGLIPLQLIEFFIAKAVVVFTGGKILLQEPVLILFNGFSVQISYLCTGIMEFILLTSALIATEKIENKKKLIGIVGAAITTFFFNVSRIVITISLIEKSFESIELAHDLLFRISLFVLIAGYYFLWYYFSVKSENQIKSQKKEKKERKSFPFSD